MVFLALEDAITKEATLQGIDSVLQKFCRRIRLQADYFGEFMMSMTIGKIAGGHGPGSPDPAKVASRIATKMMSELDTNKDGSLDKNEFVAGLGAKGVSATEAGKMFDAIDTQKKGTIARTDIESAVKSGTLKPPAGGPPRGGHGGPPPGGGAGASQSFDPADTNQDGTVTAQEALVYSVKHPSGTNKQASPPETLGRNVDKTA